MTSQSMTSEWDLSAHEIQWNHTHEALESLNEVIDDLDNLAATVSAVNQFNALAQEHGGMTSREKALVGILAEHIQHQLGVDELGWIALEAKEESVETTEHSEEDEKEKKESDNDPSKDSKDEDSSKSDKESAGGDSSDEESEDSAASDSDSEGATDGDEDGDKDDKDKDSGDGLLKKIWAAISNAVKKIFESISNFFKKIFGLSKVSKEKEKEFAHV